MSTLSNFQSDRKAWISRKILWYRWSGAPSTPSLRKACEATFLIHSNSNCSNLHAVHITIHSMECSWILGAILTSQISFLSACNPAINRFRVKSTCVWVLCTTPSKGEGYGLHAVQASHLIRALQDYKVGLYVPSKNSRYKSAVQDLRLKMVLVD